MSQGIEPLFARASWSHIISDPVFRRTEPNGFEQPCQLDGPRQAWCWLAPRPRGSAFGFLPGDVLGQHQGSSPPERRCLILAPKLRVVCPTPDSWRAKFSQARPHQLQNLFGLGGRRAGDAGEKQLVMVRESAIEQRPTLWSAKIVLHWEGKGEASVCPCF